MRTPAVHRQPPKNAPRNRRGRKKQYPRLSGKTPSCEVQNLVKYSPVFSEQPWTRYHIKDTVKGPVVWEVKWAKFYRKQENGLPAEAGCLIVARNVLHPNEVKYFFSNQFPDPDENVRPARVTGEPPPTLQWLLWVAVRRWPVERVVSATVQNL